MFFRKNNFTKTTEEIEKIRKAAHIVHLVHQELKKHIKPGVELKHLDKLAHDLIIKNNAKPAFLGYHGFPGSICASVNNVLVHGIPNQYKLQEGDIISVDVGVEKDGYYGDAAFTVGVGKISEKHQNIIDVANQSLKLAVDFIKPGITTGDLGHEIEKFVKSHGYTVPRAYVGHGIGKIMHEDPYVPNYGAKLSGDKLVEGMTICVEPMVIDGADDLITDPIDNWTVRTKHGGYCAHVEHTILITKDGAEILDK